MELILGAPIPPLRRDLDFQPVDQDGERVVVMSDLLGLDERAAAVPMAAVLVASVFDGKRAAADIRTELAGQGVDLTAEDIQRLADDLNRHGLLETPEAVRARRERLKAFSDAPVRKFSPERRGLPVDALGMAAFLGKHFGAAGGPAFGRADPPLGLAAPHIDFFRGGALYAQAYGALAGSRPPDVVVALGVAHQSPRSPWVMTRKSHETPFGPMAVDADLYDEIAGKLWYDPREEEWVHAKEHSLEFQAVWLKYLWREKSPAWVPILCSAFESWCGEKAPSSVPAVEKALERIGEALAARRRRGQRILVLAGVDLAHVGRRFGDDFDVDDAMKKKVEALDREGLEKALAGDADAFFLGGTGANAWRKVCGLSAFYTALRWIRAMTDGPVRAKLLGYDQQPDPAGGIVSFMGAVFPA